MTQFEEAEMRRVLDEGAAMIARMRPVEVKRPEAIRKPNLFGHTFEGGTETIWIKNRSGRRMIHGIASTPTIDSHGQSLRSARMMARLPVPLLSSHSKYGKGVGEVFLIRKSAKEIYMRALINESPAGDYAWDLIQSGELGCLSVGPGDATMECEVEKIRFYDQWWLKEVSICRQGANPDCIFEIFEG